MSGTSIRSTVERFRAMAVLLHPQTEERSLRGDPDLRRSHYRLGAILRSSKGHRLESTDQSLPDQQEALRLALYKGGRTGDYQ